MAARVFTDRDTHKSLRGGRRPTRKSFAVGWARGARAGGLAVALAVVAGPASRAAEPEPVKIAVFDFELEDSSAGGGIVVRDATDAEYLSLSTEEARRLLTASGRYSVVDAGKAAGKAIAAGGLRHCNGCEAGLARQLGADQSLAGFLTRITRTEYTLQIVVRDVRTGAIVSNAFTGLRMGANYSWPRGVKRLVSDRILD